MSAELRESIERIAARRLERALMAGLPLGSAGFVEGLERRFGRSLMPGRPRRRRGRGR